jgi:hypothetical protein
MPSAEIRLASSLLMFQHLYNHSDFELVQGKTDNLYFQAFTGSTIFRNECPCNPSNLSTIHTLIVVEGAEYIINKL